jgi:hypothetical protein
MGRSHDTAFPELWIKMSWEACINNRSQPTYQTYTALLGNPPYFKIFHHSDVTVKA